jgi:hypothetical protein
LTNWFEAEFILLKVLRLQPSELDRLEFYRAEILMENLKTFNEEEEGRRKKEEEGSDMTASTMMANASNNLPKMPTSLNAPNFKMPSIPNFKL